MFDFFHNIGGKIAAAFSGFVLLFSGSAAITTSEQQIRQAEATTTNSQTTQIDQTAQIEELRKEVENLKKDRMSDSAKVAVAQSKVVSNKQASKESPQATTLKLSNLNPYLDEIIANYEADLVYLDAAIESVDFYDDNFNKSRTPLSNLIDSESDVAWKNMWGFVRSEMDKQIAYDATMRNLFLSDKSSVGDTISKLKAKKESNIREGFVSPERYMADMKGVADVFDVTEALKDSIASVHAKFISDTEKFQSTIKYQLDALSAKMAADHAALMKSYGSINDTGTTYQPVNNFYQPVVYPPIQIPQTTHCTISGDGGLGLQAYMSCTTSTF